MRASGTARLRVKSLLNLVASVLAVALDLLLLFVTRLLRFPHGSTTSVRWESLSCGLELNELMSLAFSSLVLDASGCDGGGESHWFLVVDVSLFFYCDSSSILLIIICLMVRNVCSYLVIIIVSLFLLVDLSLVI